MESILFNSRDDAEEFLRGHGYVFVGAPDRWRLVSGGETVYARLARRDAAWVVTIGHPGRR